MAKILDFRRRSLTDMIGELEARLPAETEGAILVILGKDGHGHFRISGFDGPANLFLACGLLDWIKADLLSDLTKEERQP